MGSDRITVNKELGRRALRGRGRYTCNVTLCSSCLVVLRVAKVYGEFISVGLGVGAINWRTELQQHCDVE
jgi:hypothetical protein